ncbi:hypothetical protein AVEN_91988-1 [Araneus ventricosus]|uniref:Uncharacterized protein n=1 Tax=Araneus ventricosus TaxID=182803 RepID=A0A4Y1ZQL5_ARAVE|nr:hypothetical protein AVEN_91988-1 [Araneus ventricosus]
MLARALYELDRGKPIELKSLFCDGSNAWDDGKAIVNYMKINSNLPPSFVNEVDKIVQDETIVRSNLKSVSDVYSWIEEYGRTSDTKWNLRSSSPSGTRLVCW